MNNQELDSRRILVISHSFPPATTPTANRSNGLLTHLRKKWALEIVSATPGVEENSFYSTHFVKDLFPSSLATFFSKIRLGKVWNLFIWPDGSIFWIPQAFLKSLQIIKHTNSKAILVFIMPYSSGLIGVLLKWFTGLPLIINLGDSPTCTDMHPSHPSWLHYRLAVWIEDLFVHQCDAIVYVSQKTIDRVKDRQLEHLHSKFFLSRGGIDPDNLAIFGSKSEKSVPLEFRNQFNIVYTGGMNGWYEFLTLEHESKTMKIAKKVLRAWNTFGRYQLNQIHYGTSSPVYLGKAISQLKLDSPSLFEKIKVKVYGNDYPEHVVRQVLELNQIQNMIEVYGRTSYIEAVEIAQQADLLFLTLPDRPDRSLSCRISLKTYEYLITDRPILAAVPKGENWDYLFDKPGVWLVEPTDVEAMADVVQSLAKAKLAGEPLSFDRTHLQAELSYEHKAQELSKLLDEICLKQLQSPDYA